MLKRLCLAALSLSAMLPACAAEPLRADELRWIGAGMPVVRHARQQGLALDLVVQPGETPDASPIAMGIRDGRCKLVLSMRGNPGAQALAESVPAELFAAVAEAVFAHEIGHCWRYAQGAWNAVPAGLVQPAGDDAELAQLRQAMRETRREEGYADLVALAWTQRMRPSEYAAVHAWLQRFRAEDVDGRHHDTGAWLRLAVDPGAFERHGDLFERAVGLWQAGLRDNAEPDERQAVDGSAPRAGAEADRRQAVAAHTPAR
jgi:hypothetical protein